MPVVPPCGPIPTRLSVKSETVRMPDRCSVMNWNGVSYIGKTARIARNCLPPVHSPDPFQACCAPGRDEGELDLARFKQLDVLECLYSNTANLLHILHAGNAVHDRTEDDRRDDHLDRLNEGVPQGLHLFAKLWIEMTEQHAEHDRGQHLEIRVSKATVKWKRYNGASRHHRARLFFEVGAAGGTEMMVTRARKFQ